MLQTDRIRASDALDTGLAVRLACRAGRFDGPTSGLAPGYVQGNLAVLPRDWAEEFMRFCHANPRPCPLLGVGEAGSPHLPALGADFPWADLPLEPCVLASTGVVATRQAPIRATGSRRTRRTDMMMSYLGRRAWENHRA